MKTYTEKHKNLIDEIVRLEKLIDKKREQLLYCRTRKHEVNLLLQIKRYEEDIKTLTEKEEFYNSKMRA